MRRAALALGLSLAAGCNGIVGNADKPLRPPVTKVDLVLAIENTPGMTPIQSMFSDAIVGLLGRLTSPNCVDGSGKVSPSQNGVCTNGGALEFQPITDIHVAVLSSSLGARLSDQCMSDAANDDGMPVNRGSATAPISGSIAWSPAGGVDAGSFATGVRTAVSAVGEGGCRYPAQLESWYRFLAQPDPYATIIDTDHGAVYQNVDANVLAARHDFLRPDSAVAIVVVSDHNDGSLDPRGDIGFGFLFMDTPPNTRAVSTCDHDPLSKDCIPCIKGYGPADNDPTCKSFGYDYTADEDPPALRFTHMRQRYGLDVLFPVARYVRALTQDNVPKSSAEHSDDPGLALDDYAGERNPSCTNPLFASSLPADDQGELCKLSFGLRGKSQIFFATIGGAPNALVPQSGHYTPATWQALIGKSLSYDFTGVDPHMIESAFPRDGVTDDRDTKGQDLEYACTFSATRNGQTISGSAYPMVRQIAVASALGESNAVVWSACPPNETLEDPNGGYKPAMDLLVDRMKSVLAP